MKLSDFVAQYLKKIGVRHVFGYQGGSITHLIESFDTAGIVYIQNYNEQGSAMAADAYSRIIKEGIGVAIASNGPGATNLITGIANAYCDSVPVLFITGQVHTWGMKKSNKIRQESFQEIDIISMVRPITKYAVTIMNKEDILYEMEKAVKIAREGRKGPVLVDIPVDIQGMQIEPEQLSGFECDLLPDCTEGKYEQIEMLKKEIKSRMERAKRPVLLVGGGVRDCVAKKQIRQIAERYFIPVVCSLHGLDVMNHDNTAFVGFIGSYGNRYANIAVQKADLLIVLGSRLDLRQTGKNKDSFAKNAYLIHVDIDENELGHNVKEDLSVKMDVTEFAKKVLSDLDIRKNWAEWLQVIMKWKKRFELQGKPNVVIQKINSLCPDKSIIVSDVGQNQMWVAQSLRIVGKHVRILNSGGLGAMGYAIPGAIGAYYGKSDDGVVLAFTGDGGIQMNIQELCLIGNRQIPIKIFLFNNRSLGLIREVHEKYYDSHYIGSIQGFWQPDFKELASAYGLIYMKIDDEINWRDVKQAVSDETPCLFDINVEQRSYTRPELLGMDELDNQSPHLDAAEIAQIDMEVRSIGK